MRMQEAMTPTGQVGGPPREATLPATRSSAVSLQTVGNKFLQFMGLCYRDCRKHTIMKVMKLKKERKKNTHTIRVSVCQLT